MPAAPIPNSAGMAQPDNAAVAGAAQMAKAAKTMAKVGGVAGPGGLAGFSRPAAPAGGGEIIISRAEAAALTVFETEDDQTTAYRRAAEESGMSRSQIQRLKARADSARSKGFLLKGGNIVLRPRADGGTDERGLVWHNPKEKAEEDHLTKAERDQMSKEERLAFARSAKKAKADEAVDDAADEVKRKATEKVKKDLEETDADLEEVWE